MAVIPVREGVKALSEGLPAPTLTRHSWRGKGRAWIEVRGLDGPDGAELGRLVVDAVRARSGVKSVSVNRPLSRIVVTLNNDQISLRDLCRDVDEAEKRWHASGSVDPRRSDTRPKPLPGDGLLLATNALGVGATAVGVERRGRGAGAALAAPVQRCRGDGGGRRLPATAAPPARGSHRALGDGRGAVGRDGHGARPRAVAGVAGRRPRDGDVESRRIPGRGASVASSRTGAGPPRRAPGGPPAVPPGAPAGRDRSSSTHGAARGFR